MLEFCLGTPWDNPFPETILSYLDSGSRLFFPPDSTPVMLLPRSPVPPFLWVSLLPGAYLPALSLPIRVCLTPLSCTVAQTVSPLLIPSPSPCCPPAPDESRDYCLLISASPEAVPGASQELFSE